MADSYAQGYTVSQFSDSVIDLQTNTFCCGGTADTRKLVRFFKNTPGVYQNQKVIFNSPDLDLSYFYQEVTSTRVDSIQVAAGATAEIALNAKFLFILVVWPTNAVSSSKIVELGLPGQASVIGDAIPGTIGGSGITNYIVIKDLFVTNSVVPYTNPMLINNATSPYDITVYVMQAY